MPQLAFSLVDLWSPEQTRAIDRFLDAQPWSHPLQYPGWARACADSGSDREMLVGRDADAIVVVGAITRFRVVRRPIVWGLECRYGPVALDEEGLVAGIRAVATWSERRPTYVDVHPHVPQETGDRLLDRLSGDGWAVAPVAGVASSLVVELGSDADLLASFRKTTRHEVVRAQKAGVSVGIGTDSATFHALHREMADRKGLPRIQSGLFDALGRWLESDTDRGTILIARDPSTGEPIGGAVVLRAGRCAWYTWGATRRVPGPHAGHVLQFEAMRWAREQGCTRYDMGGYTPADAVATFKAGFSRSMVSFAPGFRLTKKGPGWAAAVTRDALRRRRSSSR